MVDNRAHNVSLPDMSSQKKTTHVAPDEEVDKQKEHNHYPMLGITFQEMHEQVEVGSVQSPSVKSHSMSLWYHTSAAIYINVASFAMIGCAIRIAAERLLGPLVLNIEDPGSVTPVSFFSNMLGSFILGLLAGSVLKTMPGMSAVYTAMSTGLCGSITTFSKFNQQVSLMIIGEAETEGNRFFTAFLAILIGIAAPLCSYEFGRDISMEIRKVVKEENGTDFRTSRKRKLINVFNYISLSFFIALWATLVVLSVVYRGQQDVVFVYISIVMAPFGALLRFILAKFNSNTRIVIPRLVLPLGTLLANFMGSLIVALTHVAITWADLACIWVNVLKAVQIGFCACLSTVSTFVAEISEMRTMGNIFSSHLYPFLTIVICELVTCVINGVSYGIYTANSAPPGNETCS